MLLTYNNQTIELFDVIKVPNKLVLGLSGGLDSASLFYLLCTYYPQIEIYPFVGRDIYAPFDATCSNDITSWMQEEFPHVKIHELYEFDFDDLDPTETAEVEKMDPAYLAGFNTIRGVVKPIILSAKTLAYRKTIAGDGLVLKIGGTTSNPPISEMKKCHNFYDRSEKRRNIFKSEAHLSNKYRVPNQPIRFSDDKNSYNPLLFVDKKFVAGVYEEHNLMESLFPLTSSCVGTKSETDNFTRVCKTCFWCNEKYWAFGQY
jgi:hypothetical protein